MISSTIIHHCEDCAWKSDMKYRFGCVAYTGNGKILTEGHNYYRSCYRQKWKASVLLCLSCRTRYYFEIG